GLLTNMNIVISLIYTDKMDKESIQLYEEWVELLRNDDSKQLKQFIYTIEKEIKKVEKNIFQDLDIFQALNREAVNRKDFNFASLDKELLFTQKVLTFYNDNEFADYGIMF